MKGYRSRVYKSYADFHLPNQEDNHTRKVKAWSKTYSYYLRHWWPQDKHAKIIDLGCGEGIFLQVCQNKGFQNICGIENSASLNKIRRNSNTRILEEEAIEHLEQNVCTYDYITAFDLIEHFDKNEIFRFLDACCNALKPGGRIIFQTPNGESPRVGNVLFGDLTHEICLTPQLLTFLLKEVGFSSIETRPCGPAPTDFSSGLRYGIWRMFNLLLKGIDIVEGAVSSHIYTRVFLASAVKN